MRSISSENFSRKPAKGVRCRCMVAPEQWQVFARVERFIEPAILMLLKEEPRHGYELKEALSAIGHEEYYKTDFGNLYRLLKGLEDEGLVDSTWDLQLPGPTKRTYRLTKSGEDLLRTWAVSLQAVQESISDFLQRLGGRFDRGPSGGSYGLENRINRSDKEEADQKKEDRGGKKQEGKNRNKQ
ncbi:MAG: PadR family transcriptional regulator [Actinobacteria bacterium]|nr:PadR family transcriptional regulator [Actinomycetota bacterium]MCL6104587.1 PadR family transcriptional regulator [Actinomycetota bacterium]